MKLLLPNRFKKYGLFMVPVGFVVWFAMQRGLTKKLMLLFLDEGSLALQSLNVIIAIASFFSFLTGIYFLVFSQEKVEDEMIQKTRVDSFQFAALVQFICIVIGFLSMMIFNEPDVEGLMLFFVILLFIFWLSFIGHFNYMIHIRIRQLNEKYFEG